MHVLECIEALRIDFFDKRIELINCTLLKSSEGSHGSKYNSAKILRATTLEKYPHRCKMFAARLDKVLLMEKFHVENSFSPTALNCLQWFLLPL